MAIHLKTEAEKRMERTRYELAWMLPWPEFRRPSEAECLSWWTDSIHKTQISAFHRLDSIVPLLRANHGFAIVYEIVLSEDRQSFESEHIVITAPVAPRLLPPRKEVFPINPAIQSAFNKLEDSVRLRLRLAAPEPSFTKVTREERRQKRRGENRRTIAWFGGGLAASLAAFVVMAQNFYVVVDRPHERDAQWGIAEARQIGRLVISDADDPICRQTLFDNLSGRVFGIETTITCPTQVTDRYGMLTNSFRSSK